MTGTELMDRALALARLEDQVRFLATAVGASEADKQELLKDTRFMDWAFANAAQILNPHIRSIIRECAPPRKPAVSETGRRRSRRESQGAQ